MGCFIFPPFVKLKMLGVAYGESLASDHRSKINYIEVPAAVLTFGGSNIECV